MRQREYEVRKLPKKTIVIIIITAFLGLLVFLFLKDMKEKKMTEVIANLGHKNISSMQVINKLSVEDKETRYKSRVFKVKFYDNNLQKTCVGFIHFGRYEKYSKDLDCK